MRVMSGAGYLASLASWWPGSFGLASGPVSVASSFVSPSAPSASLGVLVARLVGIGVRTGVGRVVVGLAVGGVVVGLALLVGLVGVVVGGLALLVGLVLLGVGHLAVAVGLLGVCDPEPSPFESACAVTTPPMPRAPTMDAAAITAMLRRSLLVMLSFMAPPTDRVGYSPRWLTAPVGRLRATETGAQGRTPDAGAPGRGRRHDGAGRQAGPGRRRAADRRDGRRAGRARGRALR